MIRAMLARCAATVRQAGFTWAREQFEKSSGDHEHRQHNLPANGVRLSGVMRAGYFQTRGENVKDVWAVSVFLSVNKETIAVGSLGLSTACRLAFQSVRIHWSQPAV